MTAIAKDSIQMLLAKALGHATEDQLREIVGEMVKQQLQSWDCKKILETAMEPVVKGMVKELLADPEIFQKLRERAEQELRRLISVLKIDMGSRGY